MTRLTNLASLTILVSLLISLSGCTISEVKVKPEKDSIMKEGIQVHGVEYGAFQQPLVASNAAHAEEGSFTIKEGAFTIKRGAISKGAFSMSFVAHPKAVNIVMEKGAIEPGAFVINIMPQKPPPMNTDSVVENLKKTLKPVGDISALPKDQQAIIIENSTILHNAIENLLNLIKIYNESYAK